MMRSTKRGGVWLATLAVVGVVELARGRWKVAVVMFVGASLFGVLLVVIRPPPVRRDNRTIDN